MKIKEHRSIKGKTMTTAKNKLQQQNEVSKLLSEARQYHDTKQLIQANYLYQQVLEVDADNIAALNGLGMIAMDAGMLSLATELFHFALDRSPKNISLNNNLALVYSRMADFTAAIEKYTEILKMDAMNADVHGELARLYLQTGDISQSQTHYHLAFRLNPADARNFHGLVQLDAENITEKDIEIVEKLLQKNDLPLDDRRSFYFALGAIYDASERYDEAFANYAVANMAKTVNFDAEKHVQYISKIIDTFTQELFTKFNRFELCTSQQPVFIIGMPRSGTTLIENILSNHGDVYAAGELNLINNIANKLKLTQDQTSDNFISFEYNTAESLSGFARYYLNDINNLALKNTHTRPLKITDKMPTNFIYLGLIALLFPNAHVFHCRRNPLDVSLSCFFHDFAGDHGYACDLKDIGLYYQQYERLMTHWKKVLPIKIHTVEYEDLTNNTEMTTKDIIKSIDLEWQKNCANLKSSTGHGFSIAENEEYDLSVVHRDSYDKHLHSLKKAFESTEFISSNDIEPNIH